MYKRSKNKLLFVIFILIVLLIVSILIVSVYNSKNKEIEEYKISLNSTIYDENYSYIELQNDGIIKKEWDKKYYLYIDDSSLKYSLGTEPVFYDKSKQQVAIYGTVYQVFVNGDISKRSQKTIISNLSEFQFFKLNDRKYLIIGKNIISDNFSTVNYLVVSIDKAGNALLLNNDVNIKTINPMILSVGSVKFDIANEKLINGETEIDLKKINGSTNEYEEKEEIIEKEESNGSDNQASTNTTINNNSQVYNDILNQIINITGILPGNINKTNLYKNVSLRTVSPGASYLDITYSIIDPESKYLSVFLTLTDEQGIETYYYLNKESNFFKITGLTPNKQYNLTLNYKLRGSNESIIADSLVVLTTNDPTLVRITQINSLSIVYKVKMYSEYEIGNASIILTDCFGNELFTEELNVESALSASGFIGHIPKSDILTSQPWVCLSLSNVKDIYENDTIINSYHKIKLG